MEREDKVVFDIMTKRFSVFSNRNYDALKNKKIIVSLPLRLRTRIWRTFGKYTSNDINDNKIYCTEEELKSAHGWEKLIIYKDSNPSEVSSLEKFMSGSYPNYVLDIIELFYRQCADERFGFQEEINDIMLEEKSSWLLHDGYFFKLDSEFLNSQVLKMAHDLLSAHKYAGSLDEFTEARKDLTAGNYKDAIHNACKAFESALKIIAQKPQAKLGELLHELPKIGFYEGLPDKISKEFGDKVLYALPFVRNEISGHGQGKSVVKEEACKHIANLAVNLAGCFIVFLIQRHLELGPQTKAKPKPQNATGDIPF